MKQDGALASSARARRSLFRKYFLALFAAVVIPLLVSGASDAWFGYRDLRANLSLRLRAEANAAAARIQAFLDRVRSQLNGLSNCPGPTEPTNATVSTCCFSCGRRPLSPR